MFGNVTAQDASSLPFKLRVKTNNIIQKLKTDSLQVYLLKNKNQDTAYKEVFYNIQTDKKGFLNIKIGKGTKPDIYPDFQKVNFADTLELYFKFGKYPINDGKTSKLNVRAYSFTASQVKYLDSLLSTTDTMLVAERINAGNNKLINIKTLNANSIEADSAFYLPTYTNAQLANIKPEYGQVILHYNEGVDTIPKYYSGKKWKSFVNNQANVEQAVSNTDQAIYFNTGNMYFGFHDMSEVENPKVKLTTSGINGKINLTSSDPDFEITGTEFSAEEIIEINVKNFGSTYLTAKSIANPELEANMLVVVADTHELIGKKFISPRIKSNIEESQVLITTEKDNLLKFFIDDKDYQNTYANYIISCEKGLTTYDDQNDTLFLTTQEAGTYTIFSYDETGGTITGYRKVEVLKPSLFGRIRIKGRPHEDINNLILDSTYHLQVNNNTSGVPVASWFYKSRLGTNFTPIHSGEDFPYKPSTIGDFSLYASTSLEVKDTVAKQNYKVINSSLPTGAVFLGGHIAPSDNNVHIYTIRLLCDTNYYSTIEWKVDQPHYIETSNNAGAKVHLFTSEPANVEAYDRRRRISAGKLTVTPPSGFEAYQLNSNLKTKDGKFYYTPALHSNTPLRVVSNDEKKLNGSNFQWKVQPSIGVTINNLGNEADIKVTKTGQYTIQRWDEALGVVVDEIKVMIYM